MPKQTFFNLAQDKRDLIVKIAVDEFAHNDYETASISKIVTQAGIAKGSFYQYFEDKFDLYQYLLNEGARIKGEFIALHPPTGEMANPFVYLRGLLKAGLRFDFAHRKLAKIAQSAMSGQSPFPVQWRQQMETEGINFYSNIIRQGITHGYLRSDLNVEIAGYVFYSVMRDMNTYILVRLQISSEHEDFVALYAERESEVEAIFDELFNTLEQGMAVGP